MRTVILVEFKKLKRLKILLVGMISIIISQVITNVQATNINEGSPSLEYCYSSHPSQEQSINSKAYFFMKNAENKKYFIHINHANRGLGVNNFHVLFLFVHNKSEHL